MQELFTSSKRPFYQSTQLMSIGAIEKLNIIILPIHFSKTKKWT